DYWKSEKHVLSIQDKETGELSGNAAMLYVPKGLTFFGVLATEGHISFKINIYVKDGKYRYIVHSFVHEGSDLGGGPRSYGIITESDVPPANRNKKGWLHVKDRVVSEVSTLLLDLDKAMQSQSRTENW